MKNNMMAGVVISLMAALFLSGCTIVLQKGRRSDIEKIQSLESELSELKNTKSLLENKLSQEIKDKKVNLKMEKKGLVITFVTRVLFDSGKVLLKKESLPILSKVVIILKENVPDNNIGIEGYTDNQPIKYSRWKSNWELSAQRALSVLHYLVSQGINPRQLSATGYGEYRPIVPNDTLQHRQMNRRVEIVIIPRSMLPAKSVISGTAMGKNYSGVIK